MSLPSCKRLFWLIVASIGIGWRDLSLSPRQLSAAQNQPQQDSELAEVPDEIEKYAAGSAKVAEFLVERKLADMQRAISGSERRKIREILKELLSSDWPPPPQLNVHSPAVGDVGLLPEPHRVTKVSDGTVTFLRETFRPGDSEPESVHYIAVSGLKSEEFGEGQVVELPTVLILKSTYDGLEPSGKDTFLAEPFDIKLLEQHRETVFKQWNTVREKYRRWWK